MPNTPHGQDVPAAIHENEQPRQRTIADVREQVAQEVALRAIAKAELVDGVKLGVTLTLSKTNEVEFLELVADILRRTLPARPYLFAIATSQTLLLTCHGGELLQRAILLTSSKFIGRITRAATSFSSTSNEADSWLAAVSDIGASSYDVDALLDVCRKAARAPIDPLSSPPGSRSIDQVLAAARAKLQRITPMQAFAELSATSTARSEDAHSDVILAAPTLLVDIRPAAQRLSSGFIQGSLIIERNVLEWRFDPRSDARLPIADRYDLRVIVICEEGYTSSLAALALQELGLLASTDVIGGFQAWKDAGLPVAGSTPNYARTDEVV